MEEKCEEKCEENECFICFEVSNQYEKYPLRLKYLEEYIKNCGCDGWIHNNCIQMWCNTNNTCPICRNKMIYVNIEFQYGFYIIHYLILSKEFLYMLFSYIVKFRNSIIFCVIITNIINIVSIAINNFNKTKYEYICHNTYTAPQTL
jgi:hypothetical protein